MHARILPGVPCTRFFIAVFICAFFMPAVLPAQEKLEIEGLADETVYVTYLSGSVDVDRTPENGVSDFESAVLDMELPDGCVIRTGKSSLCEITIPDRSIIRLSSGSSFQIVDASVDTDSGRVRERFNFFAGRFKAKVEKFTVRDSEFTVASGTTLAGVRGTELGGEIRTDEGADFLCFEGEVVIESAAEEFEPVVLKTGEMSFVPEKKAPLPVKKIPAEILTRWKKEFAKEEEILETGEIEDDWKGESWKPPEDQGDKEEGDAVFSLAAEVATVGIGDGRYTALPLMPSLVAGKFGIGLCLPAVVPAGAGLLEPVELYNHDEWDFTSIGDGVGDALTKIDFIRWGNKEDPFFFQAGGIEDLTLGHGFIVRGYSNTSHFPIIRSTGARMHLDTDYFGNKRNTNNTYPGAGVIR